jgi:hypothetical protein
MFLASGVINSDGKFTADAETLESVKALQDAIVDSRPSLLDAAVARQNLDALLSTEIVTTVSRSYWTSMLQSLHGKNLDVGSKYETEAPSELPIGGEAEFVSELTVIGRCSCTGDATRSNCVRVVVRSRPKESILETVREIVKSRMPAGTSIEQFDLTMELTHILDPSTLVPYSLQIVRKTDGSIRFPNGASVPSKELSREEWQFEWTHD